MHLKNKVLLYLKIFNFRNLILIKINQYYLLKWPKVKFIDYFFEII